jgi:hypothetical protein
LERQLVNAVKLLLAVVVVVALDDEATVDELPHAPRSKTPHPRATAARDREVFIIAVQ